MIYGSSREKTHNVCVQRELLLDLQLHILEDLGLQAHGNQHQHAHDNGLPVDGDAVQIGEDGVDDEIVFIPYVGSIIQYYHE